MAKQPKNTQSSGRVKFRVIEFELDGSDDSLQESLKSLAAALNRSANHIPSNRQLKNEPVTLTDLPLEESDEEAVDEAQDVSASASAKRSPGLPRKPPTVKVLNNISFVDVKPTLREFYDSKGVSSDLGKYLVVAYWYKNFLKVPDLTVDHFHTAFRFLSVPTPKNAMQPIRDLRHSRVGKFAGGSVAGTSTINHVGENHVDQMSRTA